MFLRAFSLAILQENISTLNFTLQVEFILLELSTK